MKANADVIVAQGNRLVLKNSSNKTIKMGIEIDEKQPEVQRSADAYVSFTLRNNSVSSIQLIIPTVMNPNLSPMSSSGVDLKMGQETLFKANGKKHFLLTVDNFIQDGEIIEVASLLKERKAELGLK